MTQTIPHNLPTLPTPFLGRESELAEITALLAEPSCRLLTLLGPGGIGKTRLALQASVKMAQDPGSLFTDGIYFFPLQSLSQVDSMVTAMADALKFPFSSKEEPRDQQKFAPGPVGCPRPGRGESPPLRRDPQRADPPHHGQRGAQPRFQRRLPPG